MKPHYRLHFRLSFGWWVTMETPVHIRFRSGDTAHEACQYARYGHVL